jgi:hypothetical protein
MVIKQMLHFRGLTEHGWVCQGATEALRVLPEIEVAEQAAALFSAEGSGVAESDEEE